MGILDKRFPDRGTATYTRPWYKTTGQCDQSDGGGPGRGSRGRGQRIMWDLVNP